MPPNCNICCRFLPTWQRWHRRSLRGRQCPCSHRHDARGAGSGWSLFQLWTSLGFTRCVSQHKPCCECWAMVNITDLLILKFAQIPIMHISSAMAVVPFNIKSCLHQQFSASKFHCYANFIYFLCWLYLFFFFYKVLFLFATLFPLTEILSLPDAQVSCCILNIWFCQISS